MRTKLDLFRNFAAANVYDVLVLVETWLQDWISDRELGLDGFTMFRCDRPPVESRVDVRGGGVLIAVRDGIYCRRLSSNQGIMEDLFVECNFHGKRVILGAFYVPSPSSDEYRSIQNTVAQLPYSHESDIFIVGDFNLPHVTWVNEPEATTFSAETSSSRCVRDAAASLSASINFLGLRQHNTISNTQGNMLDLIFSTFNRVAVTDDIDKHLPIDIYHPPLSIAIADLTCQVEHPSQRMLWNFKAADYTDITTTLNEMDWDALLPLDLDDALCRFQNALDSIISEKVPHRLLKIDAFPVWFDSRLKRLIRQKRTAHYNFKRTGSNLCHLEFLQLRKEASNYADFLFRRYVAKSEADLAGNPKKFFGFVNNLRKSTSLPSTMFLDDRSASLPSEMSTLFATFFESVFDGDSFSNSTGSHDIAQSLNVNHMSFSLAEVFDGLLSIDVSSGPGPDKIPNQFLRGSRFGITKPLWILFNKSLDSGLFPTAWKNSLVRPVHKCGDRTNVRNYRPIALINSAPKLLEKLVTAKLQPLLDPIFAIEQHGFRAGRSTTTNLALLNTYLFDNLEDKHQVDVVYTDFAKAFDRVNHAVILQKMEALGFRGSFLSWLDSYLKDRTYTVNLDGSSGASYSAPSGVPQGSHLGPILFNIVINDLPLSIHFGHTLLYADDAKIYHTIDCPEDAHVLQQDLVRLSVWCRHNHLALNVSKCKVVRFSRKHNIINFNYTIDDIAIPVTNDVVDLGVRYFKNGSFNLHVADVVARGSRNLGFILRNSKHFRNPSSLRCLFTSLVRPLLEYGSVSWSPYTDENSRAIETIQHKFLRAFMFRSGLPMSNFDHDYASALSLSGLETLAARRRTMDLMFLYSIINGIIPCIDLLNLFQFNEPQRVIRRPLLFKSSFCRTDYRQGSTIHRIVKTANECLSSRDDFNRSVFGFKKFVRGLS